MRTLSRPKFILNIKNTLIYLLPRMAHLFFDECVETMSSLSSTSIDWNLWWQYIAFCKRHYVTLNLKFDVLDKEFPLFHFTQPTRKLSMADFWRTTRRLISGYRGTHTNSPCSKVILYMLRWRLLKEQIFFFYICSMFAIFLFVFIFTIDGISQHKSLVKNTTTNHLCNLEAWLPGTILSLCFASRLLNVMKICPFATVNLRNFHGYTSNKSLPQGVHNVMKTCTLGYLIHQVCNRNSLYRHLFSTTHQRLRSVEIKFSVWYFLVIINVSDNVSKLIFVLLLSYFFWRWAVISF